MPVFVPTTSPGWRGSPMFPQHWGIRCWEALSWEDEGQNVLQDMFLKQSQTSLRNIVQNNSFNGIMWHKKLDDIASFVIKGIEARGERKTNSSLYPEHWDLMMLCLTNIPRDNMNGNVVFNALFHWSLNCIFFWCSLPQMMYKLPYM